jgi:hypothetical protein
MKMSISNASVLTGATVAPSGGTALAFSSTGIRNNTNTLYVAADLDQRTRRKIVCTVKEPKVSSTAPNGYTQSRSIAIAKFPLTLDNGLVTVNTLKIELATDVETSAAELAEYKSIGAQILCDADFDDFFAAQSIA